MKIRLMTYNIHGWKTQTGEPNGEQVSQLIQSTGADIIGLNEVFHPFTIRTSPKTEPALAQLAQDLDMHFVFGPCQRWPATDTMPERSYGNALLSRWPIIASAAHHLTPVEGKEQRGLLEARILLPDKRSLTVYVTHLDHTDEAARMVQLRAVRTWTVRDRNRPHALLGDFNTISPWDYEHRPEALDIMRQHPDAEQQMGGEKGPQVVAQLEKVGYVDALKVTQKPGQGTFIPSPVPLRIDYIWLSKSMAPSLNSAHIVEEEAGTEASDHRPVLADIDF